MSSSTGWGVWLHAVRPAHELANLAEAAEELGATAVLVADEGTDRDLHVTLAALALRTRRVLLIGAVTNPFSRHPVATAAAFAALAELAPGRVVAGFGAGGSRVFGPMSFKPRRPFTALVECVDVVQALWRGEVVNHAGEFALQGAFVVVGSRRLPALECLLERIASAGGVGRHLRLRPRPHPPHPLRGAEPAPPAAPPPQGCRGPGGPRRQAPHRRPGR